MLEELTAFSGGDTGDNFRAVVERELRVFCTKTAGDALNKDAGLRVYKNSHGEFEI